MSSSNHSCFESKTIKLDIKYQVAIHVLIAWWDSLVVIQDMESYSNIIHFFLDSISPTRIAMLFVDIIGFLYRLWNANSILVSSFPVTLINCRNDSISLLNGIRYPPIEGWLIRNVVGNSILSNLDRIGFLQSG